MKRSSSQHSLPGSHLKRYSPAVASLSKLPQPFKEAVKSQQQHLKQIFNNKLLRRLPKPSKPKLEEAGFTFNPNFKKRTSSISIGMPGPKPTPRFGGSRKLIL